MAILSDVVKKIVFLNQNGKIITFFVFIPVLINFVLNINERIVLSELINLIQILYIIITIAAIYLICQLVQKTFKFELLTSGFFIFINSFFIVDNIYLIFNLDVNFRLHIFLTLIFWILFLLIREKDFKKILLIIFLIIASNLFFKIFSSNFVFFSGSHHDVIYQWQPAFEMLVQDDYLYLLYNSIPGYGMYATYIQGVIASLGNLLTFAEPSILITFVLNFFYIKLIFEMKSNKFNKFIISLLFVSVVLNSGWLQTLFLSSLMLESIVSPLFAIFVFTVLSEKNPKNKYLILIVGSYLFFAKFFINYLTVLFLIFYFIRFKKPFYFILFFGIINNFIVYNYTLITKPTIPYLNGVNFNIFLLDLIDLNTENIAKIIEIFKNFLIDKILIYLLIVLLIIVFINTIYLNFTIELLVPNVLFLLNIFLVLILYTTVWSTFEVASSYRYIMNLFHLIFYLFLLNFELLSSKNLNLKTKNRILNPSL